MKHLRSRPLSTVAMLAMVAALAPPTAAAGAEAAPPKPTNSPARELRSIYTSEFGMDRPSGVTYDPVAHELLITGDQGAGSRVLRMPPGENQQEKASNRPQLDDGGNAAFDPRTKRLDATDPERLPEVTDARGSTYAPDGTRYVLDGASDAIVSIGADGPTEQIVLEGLDGEDLEGLAYNPQDELLYVASGDASTLYAVDGAGNLAAVHDLTDAEVKDLQAMTFGDSADNTDEPETQNLYVADAGEGVQLGRVAEVTLAEPTLSTMALVTATLENSHDLSALSPPSSDSAGLAYQPAADRLVMSDSEINETNLYEGVNLFALERGGTYVGGGTTVGYSNEPTGAAINPDNGWLYTTDDDQKDVYEVPGPGADGLYGTADDPGEREINTSSAGNTDPEGVAFDSTRGHLLVVDGVNTQVYRYDPGPNGQIDGGGDDVISNFDVARYGAEDPEGIEYDAVRDTIAVLDDGSQAMFELDLNGSLLNTIDVSAANGGNVAGLAVAPASAGGGQNYYLVDRGSDPGTTSELDAIDGAMYEMSANLGDITNLPPAANAGPNLMVDVGETLSMNGSAVDPDGDTITYTWSLTNGPGTPTFGTPNAATTTVTFPAAGTYTLRLTANDGQIDGFDEVDVVVHEPGAVRSISIPIDNGTDDAHEGGGTGGNFVNVTSADLELGNNQPGDPFETLVGLRFNNIPIPQGGEVVSAKVQFTVDEAGEDPASYSIFGEAADNPGTFGGAGSISARTPTVASVPWSPPAWPLPAGIAGPDQLTPELQSVLNEIISRPGWAQGNSLVVMIDGTGRRTAEARDGSIPPVLQLQFRMPAGNTAPVVSAGTDQTVTMPAQANLNGTVTDDGLPTPPALATTWSKISGPGDVAFGDVAAQGTTAAFSHAGTYVLRLTATDGELPAFADVTVTVNPADEGEPGAGLDCGDVAEDVCVQMSDHKDGLAASGVRNLGQRVGPAERVGAGALMEFTRGTVYWSPGEGAHAVWGAILNKYEQFGGPTSVLGFPETDEGNAARPGSRLSRFTGGRIYWSRGTGAHEVHGAILKKFLRLGAVRALGLPTSDERSAGVRGGRMSRFTGGRIYWSRSTGAHEVHGAILNRYLNGGGPRAWGLPVSDERRDGAARFSRFTKGRIYWSRSTGARLVYGAILRRYLRMGGHTSWLGLPVREEWSVRGGRQAAFVNGWIYWNASPYFTRVFRR